jgi:hypothetical protein
MIHQMIVILSMVVLIVPEFVNVLVVALVKDKNVEDSLLFHVERAQNA